MNKCVFDIPWVGPCNSAVVENSIFCTSHKDTKCSSCGKQATRGCDYTGQFVCGAPICDNCTGTQGDSTKGLGWGFIGHRHVPKRDAP